MIIRHYNVNNNEQQNKQYCLFSPYCTTQTKLQLCIPDYHMPPVFHLACAAHMDNVNDFKVADFSGRLL